MFGGYVSIHIHDILTLSLTNYYCASQVSVRVWKDLPLFPAAMDAFFNGKIA